VPVGERIVLEAKGMRLTRQMLKAMQQRLADLGLQTEHRGPARVTKL
jgi:hypothetical protein